eukprot:363664-Chlamydomonas_euryale.AAC.12
MECDVSPSVACSGTDVASSDIFVRLWQLKPQTGARTQCRERQGQDRNRDECTATAGKIRLVRQSAWLKGMRQEAGFNHAF